jgi:hypothetical protein
MQPALKTAVRNFNFTSFVGFVCLFTTKKLDVSFCVFSFVCLFVWLPILPSPSVPDDHVYHDKAKIFSFCSFLGSLGEMLADSTVTVSGAPPFFMSPASAGSAAAAAAATRALIMNPAAYLAAGAAAAPFLYGNNALRYRTH